MELNLEKKTPPCHVGKAEGLGDSAKPPNIVASPIKHGATVTDDIDGIPEDTTVTGGVVVITMVVET